MMRRFIFIALLALHPNFSLAQSRSSQVVAQDLTRVAVAIGWEARHALRQVEEQNAGAYAANFRDVADLAELIVEGMRQRVLPANQNAAAEGFAALDVTFRQLDYFLNRVFFVSQHLLDNHDKLMELRSELSTSLGLNATDNPLRAP